MNKFLVEMAFRWEESLEPAASHMFAIRSMHVHQIFTVNASCAQLAFGMRTVVITAIVYTFCEIHGDVLKA